MFGLGLNEVAVILVLFLLLLPGILFFCWIYSIKKDARKIYNELVLLNKKINIRST